MQSSSRHLGSKPVLWVLDSTLRQSQMLTMTMMMMMMMMMTTMTTLPLLLVVVVNL
jgi:hypothetical protein